MAGTSPELPQDIFMVCHLLRSPDLGRAGFVCSSWHSAYRRLRKHYKRVQTLRPFIYTSNCRERCLPLQACGRTGFVDSLPEPPYQHQIDLPSVSTIGSAALSPSMIILVPSQILPVFIHNPFCQLSFARIGDDSVMAAAQHGHRDCIYK
nr:uncharacterized protein LOC127322171 [Lolium perenne]